MKQVNYLAVVWCFVWLIVLVSCGKTEITIEPTLPPATIVPDAASSATAPLIIDADLLYQGTGDMPWWNDAVFYEIFVRSFNDSDGDGMPDLNYENPQVTAAMQEAARYWLQDMGVDGFRLDAIKHIIENGQMQENTQGTHEWLKGFYTFYKDVNPGALAVGEAWTGTQQVLKYTGDEVDIAFQFDLAQAILNSADFGLATLVSKEQQSVVESFSPRTIRYFLDQS